MLEDNKLAYDFNQRYLFFDFETEDLNLVYTKPFQLSWLVASKNKIEKINNKYIYWKDLKMSKDAAKITGFKWDNYKKNAISAQKVYDEFASDFYDPSVIIVAQNVLNFDAYVLKNFQSLLGIPVDYSFLSRTVDIKVLMIALQKEIKYQYDIPFLNWQYKVNTIIERGLKSSEEFMLKYFEIDYDKNKLHDAKYDIEMLFEIFKKMLFKTEIPSLNHETGVLK